MPKLTKTTVAAEQPGEDQRFVWDTEIRGFGVKIFPSGAKTFVFQIERRKAEPPPHHREILRRAYRRPGAQAGQGLRL